MGAEEHSRRFIFFETMVRRGGPRSVSCSYPGSAFNSLADFTDSRMLQEGRVVSEADLETFCKHYIPSPRAAFKYASTLSKYESRLDRRISTLKVNDIIVAMKDWTIAFDSKSALQIFILRPGSSRSIPLVQIATDFLAHKLFGALGPKIKDSAEKLYQVSTRNKIMKGAAGG